MSNWTVGARPSSPITTAEKPKMDWTKLEQHLQEIGTLHTSIYRIFRDLAPAIVLSGYWFFKHPGLMFSGNDWWYVPRISLLEIGMLIAITLVSRLASGRGMRQGQELLHKEVATSLLAPLICALVIYPCLLAKMDWEFALQVDAGFTVLTASLNLFFLVLACFIGWISID